MTEADLEDRQVLEIRAEVLKLVSASAAVRHGQADRTEIGASASSDAVAGQEALQVDGDLRENLHAHLVRADRLQTAVAGQLKLHTHSDTTLLGGAMAETHAGAMLLTAGMSDSLVAGGGLRVTALVDLWLAGLAGLEEKVGSATADGALIEAYGTLFEREYGPGNHVAGFANFSGTVHTTTATGFRPLYKVASGVRNLTPGGGGGAGPEGVAGPAAPPEPVPPPAAGAPSNAGLLGETPDIADASRGAGSFAAGADPADVAEATRNLPAVDQVAAEGGRSSEVAEELAQARYLTAEEIDETLAQLRNRAGLPNEADTEKFYDFVKGLKNESEDLQYRTAATLTIDDIKKAVEPFRKELQTDGALDLTDIGEIRELIVANAADARAAGDIDLAAQFEGLTIGFDNLVYQHVDELLREYPDLAESRAFLDGLNVAGPPPFLPARYDPAPLVEGFDQAGVIDQLQTLRADWLDDVVPLDVDNFVDSVGEFVDSVDNLMDSVDEGIHARNQALQTGADLAALAADEVARGNHPGAALDAQLALWERRASAAGPGAGLEGRVEVVRDVIEDIKEVVDAGTQAADGAGGADALRQSSQAGVAASQAPESLESLAVLAQAQDELPAVDDLRELLGHHLTPGELNALGDLREPAAIREALVRVGDSAQSPRDSTRIAAALADYDNLVDSRSGGALPKDVNKHSALRALQELQYRTTRVLDPGTVPEDPRLRALQELVYQPARVLDLGAFPENPRVALPEEVDLRLAEEGLFDEDYLDFYRYSAQQIAVDRNPLPGLDAEIAKVRDGLAGIDEAEELASQQARLQRLQDARSQVQQVLETHRGRQPQGTINWAAIRSEQWQLGYRAQDDLPLAASAPADVNFDRAVAAPGQLQDRSRALVAVGADSSLTSVTSLETFFDSSDLSLSARGSYPQPPPRPSRDIDGVALVNALGKDVNDLGLAVADPTDPLQAIKRQVYGTALQSAAGLEDPLVQLDDIAHLYQEGEAAEVFREVRARVAELVEQHRLTAPPVAQYDEASAPERLADLRRRTPTSSSSPDYVAQPPPSGLPTVSRGADATAKLTILDNDPARFVGFSPSAKAPIVRVTPAEAANLRGGQLGLEVIDAATRQPYPGGFVVRPNLPSEEIARPFERSGALDGFRPSRSLTLGPGPPPDGTKPRWNRSL